MKKITALLLALVMLFAMAGCGPKEPAAEPEGLFYDLTGLDPAATILTVEGQEVPTEMYLYWVLYAADYVEKNYPSFVGEDGRLKWDEVWSEEMTLADSVLEEALNTAKMYMIVEKWAADYGVVLSEESEQAIDEELSIIAEQLGGQEAFVEYLAQRGITEETNRRMSKVFYLYANMLSLVKEENSPLYMEDDVLYQYEGITEDTVLADHILVFYPENEEDRPNVRATMEEIRDGLLEQEDFVEAFNYIADNYSEDTGRAYNPNGYLVTADAAYVQSFKDTALALEEYELSEVVESEYGYHILLRKPLRDYVADYYLADLITVAMDNAELVWAEEYESFDLAALYAGYQDYAAELNAPADDATGESGATDGGAEESSGNSTNE